MTDIIVAAILILVVGSALGYIIREKRRGVKCIGCPCAESCRACRHQAAAPACGGSGGADKQTCGCRTEKN